MRNAKLVLSAVLIAISAGACTTHEEKFEGDAPPPPDEVEALGSESVEAAGALAEHYRTRMRQLPADALAPLAQASALSFRTTGAPGLRSLALQYADALLDARVPVGAGTAFFGADRPGRPDARVTAIACDALVDVFLALPDPRYRSAVAEAARALTSAELGWKTTRRGAGIGPDRGSRVEIAATALAARALLRASSSPIGASGRVAGTEALRLIRGSQAALGRWYATVPGRTPMEMWEWAATLFVLSDLPERTAQGIARGGVPALWAEFFSEDGRPADAPRTDPDGTGASWGLSALNEFEGDPRFGRLATARVLESLRPDGTVGRVPSVDAPVQALYATGLARRGLNARRAAADER